MNNPENVENGVRTALSEAWRKHYAAAHGRMAVEGCARSMDYSNERCELQIYAHLLEAVGPLSGKKLLDAGCGWGITSLIFRACGAAVTGVDIVPETIASLRSRHPDVSWDVADLNDSDDVTRLPLFDTVVAAEVLEYLEFRAGTERLWTRVAPGGRLVGCIPNAECPIVKRVVERDGPTYAPGSVADLTLWGRRLPGAIDLKVKGLGFQQDQSFLPFAQGDWGAEVPGTPNRILFVILRG